MLPSFLSSLPHFSPHLVLPLSYPTLYSSCSPSSVFFLSLSLPVPSLNVYLCVCTYECWYIYVVVHLLESKNPRCPLFTFQLAFEAVSVAYYWNEISLSLSSFFLQECWDDTDDLLSSFQLRVLHSKHCEWESFQVPASSFLNRL